MEGDDHPLARKTLQSIGQRIRNARKKKGLTQEELAQPEFSKGYISALERGAVRPSLKALSVFAKRLDMSIADFLGAPNDLRVEPDIDAIEEDLQFQFNYVRMLIRSSELEEAMEMLAQANQEVQEHQSKLSARTRYRVPFLRGLAFLQRSQADLAQAELEQALDTAMSDREAEATVRNILGVVHYQLDRPQLALEQHLRCLHAVESGIVKDLSLRLSIYRNLANDYWALDDLPQAIGVYKTALHLLEDVNDLGRQAAIYWGLASAYRASGDWSQAKLYATRALHIYEAEQDRTGTASISMNLAELFLREARYEEADQLLSNAQTLLSGTKDEVLLSNLYLTYADLAYRQGKLEQASQYIEESLKHGEPLVSQLDKPGHMTDEAPAYAIRTYVQALHVAAQIEEGRGNTQASDALFDNALSQIKQTDFKEMEYAVTFGYAEILQARGTFEKAMEYYRLAAQLNRRPSQAGN